MVAYSLQIVSAEVTKRGEFVAQPTAEG